MFTAHIFSALILSGIGSLLSIPNSFAQDLQYSGSEGRASAIPVNEATPTAVFPSAQTLLPRRWSQLVWNQDSQHLSRITLGALLPKLSDGISPQFDWENTADAFRLDQSMGISGNGVMTWRPLDAARYGRANIFAQYQGMFSSGAFDGQGKWIHQSGSAYEGAWQNGLMHGHGRLTMPSGDVYLGAFNEGLFDGEGTLIAADGTHRTGVFKTGVLTDKQHFVGLDGNAVPATGAAVQPVNFSMTGLVEAIKSFRPISDTKGRASITVTASKGAAFCCDGGPPSLGYRAVSRKSDLLVLPNDKALMQAWAGKRDIVLSDFNQNRWTGSAANTYTRLLYTSDNIQQANLIFGLKNRSGKTLRIASAYLEMDESLAENRPLLIATNNGGEAIMVENFGWANAQNATLTFRLYGAKRSNPSRAFSVPLGTIKNEAKFSVKKLISELGLNWEGRYDISNKCRSANCIQAEGRKGEFGSLRDQIHVSRNRWGMMLRGSLSYSWSDGRGKRRKASVPFTTFLTMGLIVSTAECEGGEYRTTRDGKPLNMAVSKGARRIPVDISGSVSNGKLERWRISFRTKRSSRQKFSMVFKLSDGTTIRSRRINMLLFQPKQFNVKERGFRHPC